MTTTFEFLERVTTAGQGEIWRVRDTSSQKYYIAKKLLLTGNLTTDVEHISRFKREVRTQGRLVHGGIMPVLGVNFDDRPPWYIMPIAKTSLDAEIRRLGRLAEAVAVEVLLKVMDTIEYAHSEGVLHRDLKPANILYLSGDGFNPAQWVVADFGLCLDRRSDSATITQTRVGLGSIAYTAPEQFKNAHQIGETADVYALGKILYFCLTGDDPFPVVDLAQVPPKFRYIIDKATANDRGRRFYSVSAMKAELAALGTGAAANPYLNAKSECEKYALNIRLGLDVPNNAVFLYGLVLNNALDEQLILEIINLFDADILGAINHHCTARAIDNIVETFDASTNGSFTFSFCDVIADVFIAAFSNADDLATKAVCLRKLLTLGYSHNRYYVRDSLMMLLSGLSDADVAIAVEALSESPQCVPFLAGSAVRVSLPPAIRSTVDLYGRSPF